MSGPERWVPVPGYEGWYEASTLGRIRIIQRPEKGWHDRYPYVLAPLLYRKGYLKMQFCACRGTRRLRRRFIHRVIYEAFHGPIPNGVTVNHKDGDKQNNRPENLELATYQEQASHARRLGLAKDLNGKPHHLTVNEVREIRRLHADGATYDFLAAEFGVVHGTIGHIVKRRYWKHVT